MAKKENMRDRLRRINPLGLAIADKVEEAYKKAGGRGVCVDLTEDMTQEEQEMALFEGFLKEGYPVQAAARKAKEWLALLSEFTGGKGP